MTKDVVTEQMIQAWDTCGVTAAQLEDLIDHNPRIPVEETERIKSAIVSLRNREKKLHETLRVINTEGIQ